MHSRAFGDSEAIVKDRKVDRDGFPLVLIEWDKEFWNFTGQSDGWAFENHFDIVERHEENNMPDDKIDKLIESLSAVISEFKEEAPSKEDTPPQQIWLKGMPRNMKVVLLLLRISPLMLRPFCLSLFLK